MVECNNHTQTCSVCFLFRVGTFYHYYYSIYTILLLFLFSWGVRLLRFWHCLLVTSFMNIIYLSHYDIYFYWSILFFVFYKVHHTSFVCLFLWRLYSPRNRGRRHQQVCSNLNKKKQQTNPVTIQCLTWQFRDFCTLFINPKCYTIQTFYDTFFYDIDLRYIFFYDTMSIMFFRRHWNSK